MSICDFRSFVTRLSGTLNLSHGYGFDSRCFLSLASCCLLFFLVGCSGGGPAKKSVAPTPPQSKCGTVPTGHECKTVTVNEDERAYLIYQPNEVMDNPSITIFLHGAPGSMFTVSKFFEAVDFANKHGSIAVIPKGEGNWAWSSEIDDSGDLSKDSQLISAIIDQMIVDHQVNAEQVFIAGYSAGGFMVYQIACEIPEKIAGAIAVSGQARGDLFSCNSAFPMAIHHIHGTSDVDVPMNGRSNSIASVDDTLSSWTDVNQCDTEPMESDSFAITTDNKTATTFRYQNCDELLEFTKVYRGVHEESYNMTVLHNLMVDFFQRSIE